MDVAPSGMVADRTAYTGRTFSLDLSQHITGVPAPTFSVRNNSLNGTGLTLSGTTISGMPLAGTHTIALTATNRESSLNFSFRLTVTASVAPTWSPTDTSHAVQVGTALSWDVSGGLAGTPTPTVAFGPTHTGLMWLSVSGTTLSGTPPPSEYMEEHLESVVLRATNFRNHVDATFSLYITQTAPAAPTGGDTIIDQFVNAGEAYSLDLATVVMGPPTPSFAELNNSFPSWLSITGTTLSGTAPATGGVHSLSIRAMNTEDTHDFSFSITVRTRPTGTVPSQTATAGQAFSLNLADSITGVPDPTFSVRNNSLAGTGLSLSGTTLSGTPSNSQQGAHTWELRASNAVGDYDFTIALTTRGTPIWGAIPQQNAATESVWREDFGSFLTATPSATVSFASGYMKPDWLTLTGTVLSGTPPIATYPTAQTITIQLTATNSLGSADVNISLAITAQQSPMWGANRTNAVQRGTALSWDVSSILVGTPTPTVAFTSGFSVPSWLSLNGATLTGTPPIADFPSQMMVPILLTATNSVGSAAVSLDLTVTIQPTSLPSGSVPARSITHLQEVNVDLSQLITGVPLPTFAAVQVPSGIRIDGNVLRGTAAIGAHTLMLQARNAVGTYNFNVLLNVVSAVTEDVPRRRVRRGMFLRSLEEDIIIRRARPQRQEGESEYIYPLPEGQAFIKALIADARSRTDESNIVELDFQYICNLTPVRPEICLNDQVVRNSGEPKEQVLTVTFVCDTAGIQQLYLKDLNRVVE